MNKAPPQTAGTTSGANPIPSTIETTPISNVARSAAGDMKPEDLYEILCNDTVLPLDMTLAAVRQYVWRQVGELVMYYRRKVPAAVEGGNTTTNGREKVDAVNGH